MGQIKEMKWSIANRISGLWFIGVILSCCSPANRNLVQADPEPIPPGLIYADSFADDAESFLLLQRLKQIAERKHEVLEQARDLEDEQLELREMLEAEVRRNQHDYAVQDSEILPMPSAITHPGERIPAHSGKRTTYMSLCHFKICNMGRKRQL